MKTDKSLLNELSSGNGYLSYSADKSDTETIYTYQGCIHTYDVFGDNEKLIYTDEYTLTVPQIYLGSVYINITDETDDYFTYEISYDGPHEVINYYVDVEYTESGTSYSYTEQSYSLDKEVGQCIINAYVSICPNTTIGPVDINADEVMVDGKSE